MDSYDGAEAVERAWREGLKPDPLLTVSEWADRYRVLSQRASSEPGRWRTERTPYLREIMDCLSPSSPVQRVALMKGAQIGGTECGNSWIGYVIHQAPGPMMAVAPTVELAKLEFRRRIEQFQHSTLVFQLCRPVWRCWLRDAVLAGALELPGFAENPASYLAVKWIPPKWDWVDPLKDRKAEIEAIEAGLKSRSDVIESEGYDAEEVDRRIAADHAREEELGLKFGRPAAASDPGEREERESEDPRPMQSEEQAA